MHIAKGGCGGKRLGNLHLAQDGKLCVAECFVISGGARNLPLEKYKIVADSGLRVYMMLEGKSSVIY